MRRSLTTNEKLDLAAMRQAWGNNGDVLALIAAAEAFLATPTPMPTHGSEQYACGWDAGWGACRREARKLFGVGDD